MNGHDGAAAEPVLRVAVNAPLHRCFDYLPPAGVDAQSLRPGIRLWVPFGRRRRFGVLVEVAQRSTLEPRRLRRVQELIDAAPVLPPDLVQLLRFAADWYRQPPGEVFAGALPAALRQGGEARAAETLWQLTEAGRAPEAAGQLRRAPAQRRVLDALAAADLPAGGLDETTRRALGALAQRGLAQRIARTAAPMAPTPPQPPATDTPAPTDDQRAAMAVLNDGADGFRVHLLLGVTGSGKTELYMSLIARRAAEGLQSLVLVPEISLTPQLIGRFRERFGAAVAVLHSGLGDAERLATWRAAADGSAAIVVGTRSALFVPLVRPGLIVLDEEHDTSYRQQDGVRYSARDLAVVRARTLGVQLVLGSATPSLESLRQALEGRYTLCRLPRRAHGGDAPALHLVDLTRHARQQGLSTPLLEAMRRQLDDGGQVLLYLNRRGFAPALWCEGCGQVVDCRRCDARMTLHHGDARLRCHHCGAERTPPATCAACGGALAPVGQGTERVEQALQRLFPDAPLARIDRDAVRRRGALEERLAAVREGRVRILLGTQMLTKGHDFPDIGLVGILDADQGLFSSDFRASERLAQTIVQVAGRAGRGQRPGRVLIQTRFVDHPLLRQLVSGDYEAFARALLHERRDAGWPPYTRLALLRAEAATRAHALAFLEQARGLADAAADGEVSVLGPAPAGMERRAGRFRHQLLLQAADHRPLQRLLARLLGQLEALPAARRVRWTVDVDPPDLL